MRGKFAETLLARPGVQVHVAGRAAAATAEEFGGVHRHRLFAGARLSLGRLLAQYRYWWLLGWLRPALVVVHAPELLPLTLLWQGLGRVLGQRRQFIYDIRENYALNVRTQQVYGGGLRRVLAAGLRWVEGAAAQQAAAVILAEASYADELPFLAALPPARVLVLENKYQPQPGEPPPPARPAPAPTEPLRLLYSGTISELNGVHEALALAAALHGRWPGGARLTVVGCCQQPALLTELQALAAQHPEWLTLRAGAAPVPHAEIVNEIRRTHFGLLPYRPHPSTWRCRPTKLFEYLAQGLPVLLPPNALWTDLATAHRAGISLNFEDAPAAAAAVQAAATAWDFYPAGPPPQASWASEDKKLGALLDTLL